MADPCAEWLDAPSIPLHGGPCGEETICVVRCGCVHEHLTEQRMCSGCAANVQQAAGGMLCGRCLMTGPEPHRCLFLVAITWDQAYRDPEPVTIVQQGGETDLVDPWRRHAEIIKTSRDADGLYVAWTWQAEEPQWIGTRAQALAAGCEPGRLGRADDTGSSYFRGAPGCTWRTRSLIAEQRGTLPRDKLAAYATAYMDDKLTEAYQMLRPFED